MHLDTVISRFLSTDAVCGEPYLFELHEYTCRSSGRAYAVLIVLCVQLEMSRDKHSRRQAANIFILPSSLYNANLNCVMPEMK